MMSTAFLLERNTYSKPKPKIMLKYRISQLYTLLLPAVVLRHDGGNDVIDPR
jgi:hypothetical protein